MHPIVKNIQELLPELRVGAVKAGKGLERYIVAETGWASELPIRKTVVLLRSSTEVVDLGQEDWTKLTKQMQHRHAKPSHVMLCIFATQVRREPMESEEETDPLPSSTVPGAIVPETPSAAPAISVDIPTWTPVSASVSGPKFLSLSEADQGVIRKLHNNLGHPTSDKLSRHLKEAKAQQALIDGASDYLCPSCAERSRPQLSTPGNLKDPKEFNEKVSVDWFEWKSQKGFKADVFHILDEATRFHLGYRFPKDSSHSVHAMQQLWFPWAGYPQQIAHDQGGEFMTPEWKDLLLQHGIQPILSAAPWQRGRIERHGGIVEEMLDRIDQELPIENQQQFDQALHQCFHAKNTMSIVDGFSPEQAVLGKASRLPASVASDEETPAHLSSMSDDLPSSKFQQKLQLRTAARAAFAKADSSEALRPDSPMSSIPEEAENQGDQNASDVAPSTASLDSDEDNSQTAEDMQPVYNVTVLENTQDTDVYVEDCNTVWTDHDSHDQACVSFAFELPQQQLSKFLKRPKEHFPCLTAAAKKSRNEVTYSELTAEEQELFRAAKQKELKCWLDTSTVQAILRERIHPSRIMSSRWILTWKEDPTSSTGRKAKARLVVKGFQDPDIGTLCSDSPTMTRDSRMLLLQTVASQQWLIQAFDITTAFLRGRSDERELAMEAPAELKELLGMRNNQVCLLKGNAYGRVDAPLLFYKEFRKRLEEVGFSAHPLDNCLFLLRNPQDPKKLDGILGTHVDDGIGGGNENFERALSKLEKNLPFGSREYGHCRAMTHFLPLAGSGSDISRRRRLFWAPLEHGPMAAPGRNPQSCCSAMTENRLENTWAHSAPFCR
eukprot:s1270_g22.t1